MRRRASNELDRAIARGYSTDFDPSKPWEYVFQHAEDEVKYWHPELEEPALIAISGNRSSSGFVDGDALVSESSGAHIATSGTPGMVLLPDASGGARLSQQDRRPPAKPQPPKRPTLAIADRPVRRQHNVENGKFITNRSGHVLCLAFNSGACGAAGSMICPKDPERRHNCNLCLSTDHSTTSCEKGKVPQKKGGKGGKAGGRGRNK
jgi:WD40 repeat protein